MLKTQKREDKSWSTFNRLSHLKPSPFFGEIELAGSLTPYKRTPHYKLVLIHNKYFDAFSGQRNIKNPFMVDLFLFHVIFNFIIILYHSILLIFSVFEVFYASLYGLGLPFTAYDAVDNSKSQRHCQNAGGFERAVWTETILHDVGIRLSGGVCGDVYAQT